LGTRRLTLLRHGQAQPLDACADDFERPLTRRGGFEAREMGKRIVHRDLVPDLILASPAERAWATAEIIAEACELDEDQIQAARELYMGTPETIWRQLTRCDSAICHVLICGHNPGLSQVASRLGPTPKRLELATGGLATVVWNSQANWDVLQPETASTCELDDPESMTDL
jgi:phosphohistidine phosphatase